MGTRLPFAAAADAIALVGLLATARVFLSLAAMDVGTAFGTLGARREMMVGLSGRAGAADGDSGSPRCCPGAPRCHLYRNSWRPAPSNCTPAWRSLRSPSPWCCWPKTRRIPIDNPATHLELTMIHEAMLLEYSARHLALMEWAAALKLFNYACIGFALFLPWGISVRAGAAGAAAVDPGAGREADGGRRRPRADRDSVGEAASLSRAGVSRHRLPVCGTGAAGAAVAEGLTA